MTEIPYLTLADVARTLPSRPSIPTIWRWCRKGIRARDGSRVKLQHLRIGGRLYVEPDALRRFGRALAEADSNHFESSHDGEPTVKVSILDPPVDPKSAAKSAAERMRGRGLPIQHVGHDGELPTTA